MRRLSRIAGLLLALAGLSSPAARATITINTQFAQLYAADGATPIGAGKIGLLVVDEGAIPGLADPQGTVLVAGNYLGGSSDDRILAVFTSTADVTGAGDSGFRDTLPSLTYDGGFNVGEKLYLLWFPTLTADDQIVGDNISYGVYRSDVINVASGADIAFLAPADGTTADLYALTGAIAPGSDVTVSDFTAKFLTVPEPAAAGLLALAATALLLRRRRSRLLLLAALLASATLGAARAQLWNAGAGSWQDPENWLVGLPASGDLRTAIANGGTVTVLTGDAADSFGDFEIAGLTGAPSSVIVQPQATLDAHGGNVVLGRSHDTALEEVIGSGSLSITGYLATLNNVGSLAVGYGEGDGHLVINGGGKVTSASGSVGYGTLASPSTVLVTGGGSTWTTGGLAVDSNAVVTVEDGGVIALSSGSLSVGAGATIRGNGTIDGPLTLAGTISPLGTFATGAQTWNAGGRYVWTITDALGDDHSQLSINGALAIQSTVENPFVIELSSAGSLPDFNPGQNYDWTIASATGGIGSFAAAQLAIDASGFTDASPARFSISTSGDDLVLHYAAVPEVPVTGAAIAVLLVAVTLGRRFA